MGNRIFNKTTEENPYRPATPPEEQLSKSRQAPLPYAKARIGLIIILFNFGLAVVVYLFGFMLTSSETSSSTGTSVPYLAALFLTGGLHFAGMFFLTLAPNTNERVKAIFAIVAQTLSLIFAFGFYGFGFDFLVSTLARLLSYVSIFYVIAYCRQIGENVDCIKLSNWAVISRNWLVVFVVITMILVVLSFIARTSLTPSTISTPLGSAISLGLVLCLTVSGLGAAISQIYMLITAVKKLGGKIE